MRVRVQDAPFDLGAEANAFVARQQGAQAGAIVTFTGIVRDIAQGLDVMEIEHYPGMTERALEAIIDQAHQRWPLADAFVLHRYGRMHPDEPIMMVATAASASAGAGARDSRQPRGMMRLRFAQHSAAPKNKSLKLKIKSFFPEAGVLLFANL